MRTSFLVHGSTWSLRQVRGPMITAAILATLIACNPSKPSCTFALAPASASYPQAGGSGSASLSTQSSCGWTASADVNWITISGPADGKGNASVGYSIAANTGTASRSGTLTVAGQRLAITQTGVSTFPVSGTVRDAFMGGVISGATVAIVSGPSSGSATSDNAGRYTLSDLQPGSYVIRVSRPPYGEQTLNVTVPTSGAVDAGLLLNTPSPPTIGDLTGNWTGTGAYPNDPFKLEILQTGNSLSGAYVDQHDGAIGVTGTYGNPNFLVRVNFGDAVLDLECTIDDARHAHGVQRTSALGNRPYNFTMTR